MYSGNRNKGGIILKKKFLITIFLIINLIIAILPCKVNAAIPIDTANLYAVEEVLKNYFVQNQKKERCFCCFVYASLRIENLESNLEK